MARATKAQLEEALKIANGALTRAEHPLRLWHDGGAYGNGPRLYWHLAHRPQHEIDHYAGPRQRIGLCLEWVRAFSQGAWAIVNPPHG